MVCTVVSPDIVGKTFGLGVRGVMAQCRWTTVDRMVLSCPWSQIPTGPGAEESQAETE